MHEINLKSMKKLFASLIFGLLLSSIVFGSLTPAYGAGQLYGMTAKTGIPSILFSIDTLTGAATQIGPGVGFDGCGAMDYDPVSNTMFATCGNSAGPKQLITINLGTGVGTLVATITGPLTDNITDISFHSDNTLFAMTGFQNGGSLYTINKLTGVSALIGPSSGGWGQGIAFSPSDTLFHSTGDGQPGTGLDTVSTLNGAASPKVLYTFQGFDPGLNNPRMNAMDFMPGSNILFGSVAQFDRNIHSIATIDPNTAVVTNIGFTEGFLDSIAFVLDVEVGGEFSPIDSTALMLAGLQSSAIWMLPILAGAAGVGVYFIKTRMNKE